MFSFSLLSAGKGFGGKFGVERDRVDSSAHSWEQGKGDSPADSQQNGRDETAGADIRQYFS